MGKIFKTILLVLVCSSFLIQCTLTPDPNYLPINLGETPYPPWDAPLYTAEQLASFFPTTNYSTLTSVYVATNGSDVTGNGSSGSPYRTIKKAVENHEQPGIIIRVRQGTYYETFRMMANASKASPFVLFSEDGSGAAIINGKNGEETIVQIRGRYNIIDGFQVHNSQDYGIGIFSFADDMTGGDDSYCVVRNCKVFDVGRDIVKSSRINFLLIENNDIYGSRHLNQRDNCIDGVAVYHTLCRNNYLHDNTGGTGGYFKCGSANNVWVNNIFENIGDLSRSWEGDGAGLQFGGTGSFSWRDNQWYEYPSAYGQIAYNNIFINCSMAGITMKSAWNCQIYNNSFYNCGFQAGDISGKKAVIRIVTSNNIGTKNIDIFNNVFYNDAAHSFDTFIVYADENNSVGPVYHGYNSAYNAAGSFSWNYIDGPAVSEKVEDVLYLDPANGDLSLNVGSPAIDSGTNLIRVPVDYNLTNRPVNLLYDRGAYEQ